LKRGAAVCKKRVIMTEPIICVEHGKLQGKISSNIRNENFYSFQGIPYAKPPIGALRFKDPQPPEPWTGVRDATKDGSECYSRDMIFKKLVGSEDCLFLNVYTQQLPSNTNKTLKPVMVWIHGGAFRSGSNKTDVYGPEFLLTEDIVLVTINYRLGIFGFLSFEDASLGVPGNAGLKDMVMALKWVQKNISKFSGDPNNVTIFGESAGGASVHYLVLSPLAAGLFHKAIAQSGCALNAFARERNDLTVHLASILDLKTPNEKEILQRLNELPVDKLYEIYEKVAVMCDALQNAAGKLPFAPVIEKPSPGAFITEEPLKIIKSGSYNKIPIVFGYTTREGMLFEIWIKPRKPTMPKDFETLIPFMLEVERGSDSSKNIANKIKQFYYGTPGSEDQLDNFYLIHTDNSFLRDIMFATQHHSASSDQPIFLYRMSVESKLNLFKKIGSITAPGVSHGDDIGYLFKTKLTPELQSGSLEELSVNRFVKYWTNFAKFGNPNPKDKSDAPEWKPVKPDEINFIDIGENITAGTNPESERMQFWRDIFSIKPQYSI
jgi:carboxylesterase type B